RPEAAVQAHARYGERGGRRLRPAGAGLPHPGHEGPAAPPARGAGAALLRRHDGGPGRRVARHIAGLREGVRLARHRGAAGGHGGAGMSDGQGMHDHDRPSGGDRPAEDPARPDGSGPGTEPERENGGSLSHPSDSSDPSDSSGSSDFSGSGSPAEPASPRSGEPVSVEGSVSVGGPGIVGGSADDEGAASAEGAAGSGDPGSAGGLGADERALRDLLHRAVSEGEPSDGALDCLRRAVPARRAGKRQALVGMAAAALFVGTAVPAVVHVSTSSGSDANPSAVGHASQAQGGTSQGKGPDNGASSAG